MDNCRKENNLTREVRKGIILWYDFKADSKVLYDGMPDDSICEALVNLGLNVDCTKDVDGDSAKGLYDYVVSITGPEKSLTPEELLTEWKSYLKTDGRLLLAMNNRMGLRYFCGDRDPYTNRNFDGIEGYQRAYRQKEDTFFGRCYDEAELREMLKNAGFQNLCVFFIMKIFWKFMTGCTKN